MRLINHFGKVYTLVSVATASFGTVAAELPPAGLVQTEFIYTEAPPFPSATPRRWPRHRRASLLLGLEVPRKSIKTSGFGFHDIQRAVGRRPWKSPTAFKARTSATHAGIPFCFQRQTGSCCCSTKLAQVPAHGGECGWRRLTAVKHGAHRSDCRMVFWAPSRINRFCFTTAACFVVPAPSTTVGVCTWNGRRMAVTAGSEHRP